MAKAAEKPKPVLVPELCKGCGRCVEACPRDCISPGDTIHQTSGLIPVVFDYEDCNGCGVCIMACPEPYCLSFTGHTIGAAAGKGKAAQEDRPSPESLGADKCFVFHCFSSSNFGCRLRNAWHSLLLKTVITICVPDPLSSDFQLVSSQIQHVV